MCAQLVSQGNIYVSTSDPKYQSSDIHAVEARDFVFSESVRETVRKDVAEIGTYTSETTLEGAVVRALEVLHRFETRRRKCTPADYFGVDHG